MDFGDTCPKHQNVKETPERGSSVLMSWEMALHSYSPTRPPGDFLLFAAPQKKSAFCQRRDVRAFPCLFFPLRVTQEGSFCTTAHTDIPLTVFMSG